MRGPAARLPAFGQRYFCLRVSDSVMASIPHRRFLTNVTFHLPHLVSSAACRPHPLWLLPFPLPRALVRTHTLSTLPKSPKYTPIRPVSPVTHTYLNHQVHSFPLASSPASSNPKVAVCPPPSRPRPVLSSRARPSGCQFSTIGRLLPSGPSTLLTSPTAPHGPTE